MKVLSADLIYMLDKPGRTFSSDPNLRIVVDRQIPSEEFRWDQVAPRLFLGECDGWFEYHHHDGSDANLGGYSGRAFTITMRDGTRKVLRGPWSGGEYSVWRDAGIKLVNVLTKIEGDTIYTFGLATKPDRVVDEILPHVRPIEGPGAELFSASLLTTDPMSRNDRWHVSFCITKGKPQHLLTTEQLAQYW